ncbi:excisionase family DNA-binding protein [Marinifilum sp. RC60d5]|uniref:excisionase family DNA-binding protein n=1 Tax=Marinifilum sp. RC60d5 TaxID=3458414 RepID=UPI004036BB7F
MKDLNQMTPNEITHALFNELEAINKRLVGIENELKTFTPLQQKEILTLKEASEYLSLSKSYLYKLTSVGKLGFYKTGKKIYFKREQLNEYLTRNYYKSRAEIKEMADNFVLKTR